MPHTPNYPPPTATISPKLCACASWSCTVGGFFTREQLNLRILTSGEDAEVASSISGRPPAGIHVWGDTRRGLWHTGSSYKVKVLSLAFPTGRLYALAFGNFKPGTTQGQVVLVR